MSIANTDLSLLRFVKDTAGIGRITSKRTVAAHHTASYAYRVTSRQALALLEQVAPFLRTYKRARADLALADYLRLTPRNGKYSSSIAKERQEFETTFLAIVQSGTPPEPDGCSFGWNLTMRLEESSPHYAVRDRSLVARPFI